MKRVLVFAAHPDDEILGCGATMARHVRSGDEVHVVILAEGATSRDAQRNPGQRSSELSALARAAHAAKDILGVTSLSLLGFPDNRLDSVDLLDVIKVVEKHVDLIRPETIYTHHGGDLNVDHRRVHQAVLTACRPQPNQSVRDLLFFEVPSSTEWQSTASPPFLPNWFVDVSQTMDLKIKALEAYRCSIEAVECLARWRGASVGRQAAEAFMVGRHLETEDAG